MLLRFLLEPRMAWQLHKFVGLMHTGMVNEDAEILTEFTAKMKIARQDNDSVAYEYQHSRDEEIKVFLECFTTFA